MPARFEASFTMKSLLPFIFFLSLILGTYAAVYFERQIPIPGREGQCYDKQEKQFYTFGQEMKWRNAECGRRICMGYKEKVYIETQTCGSFGGVPDNCYTKVNLDLPYPECCEQLVCSSMLN